MIMPRVKMNVSGTHFEFDSNILDDREYHTLSKMCKNAECSGEPLEFVVDRPSDCFAAVLSFYQTDELHMPTTICPKAFKKELKYWGVPESDLDKCCMYKYFAFFEDFEKHEKFQKESFVSNQIDGAYVTVSTGRGLQRIRRRIWRVIDLKENSSVCGKIYFLLVFLMVLLCILTLAFSTVPAFQRSLNKCELLEYLDHSNHEAAEQARIKLGNPDCSGAFFDDMEEIESNDMEWVYYDEYYHDGNWTTATTTITLPQKRVRLFVFDVLEIITACFFTVDLFLRLLTCPSLFRYFWSIINISDILALVGFYIHTVVIHTEKQHKYETGWVRFINYMQIFRVMRLFRFVKEVRASRVLAFSLRQNGRDMLLLVLLVLIGVSTSACLLYFIEDEKDIESIPIGWYWAMITLTTVGYGDITPKTGFGRIVASILAICGVLLLSITLPMFVNNFLTLYQYSCLDDIVEVRHKSRRHLKGAMHASAAVTKLSADGNTENNNDQDRAENQMPAGIYSIPFGDLQVTSFDEYEKESKTDDAK